MGRRELRRDERFCEIHYILVPTNTQCSSLPVTGRRERAAKRMEEFRFYALSSLWIVFFSFLFLSLARAFLSYHTQQHLRCLSCLWERNGTIFFLVHFLFPPLLPDELSFLIRQKMKEKKIEKKNTRMDRRVKKRIYCVRLKHMLSMAQIVFNMGIILFFSLSFFFRSRVYLWQLRRLNGWEQKRISSMCTQLPKH